MVSWGLGGDWEGPRCDRTLLPNGTLTEMVFLEGSPSSLTKEEVDRYVASFPIRRLGEK
jgi:hypothetical protein